MEQDEMAEHVACRWMSEIHTNICRKALRDDTVMDDDETGCEGMD
jgi:hypothetical protein